MNEIAELAKAISADKIERAKAASTEEKLLDGPRLFSQACEAMRAGLRVLRPGIGDDEIEAAIWNRNYTR